MSAEIQVEVGRLGPVSGAGSVGESVGPPRTGVPMPAHPLDPAPGLLADEVAPVRRVVATHLRQRSAGDLVLVAVSGGADSLTLAAVTAAVAPMFAVRVGAVIVDHQLFPGSTAVAEEAAQRCRAMGLDPVQIIDVDVDVSSGQGVEGAARIARYAALRSVAQMVDASEVLLGHTLDDQAETVLMGLARGSGARSLAGMSVADGLWGRPLLSISRAVVRGALEAMLPNVDAWQDPANEDPRFLRSRVRHELMPVLDEVLGAGAVEALARTADHLRADNVALEVWAQIVWETCAVIDGVTADIAGDLTVGVKRDVVLAVEPLAPVPEAVRRRVLRRALLAAGVPGGSLTAEHIQTVDLLVADWRGRGPAALPGKLSATRSKEALRICR
jgi:tRNA(Ile)-lysidine synthase